MLGCLNNSFIYLFVQKLSRWSPGLLPASLDFIGDRRWVIHQFRCNGGWVSYGFEFILVLWGTCKTFLGNQDNLGRWEYSKNFKFFLFLFVIFFYLQSLYDYSFNLKNSLFSSGIVSSSVQFHSSPKNLCSWKSFLLINGQKLFQG